MRSRGQEVERSRGQEVERSRGQEVERSMRSRGLDKKALCPLPSALCSLPSALRPPLSALSTIFFVFYIIHPLFPFSLQYNYGNFFLLKISGQEQPLQDNE